MVQHCQLYICQPQAALNTKHSQVTSMLAHCLSSVLGYTLLSHSASQARDNRQQSYQKPCTSTLSSTPAHCKHLTISLQQHLSTALLAWCPGNTAPRQLYISQPQAAHLFNKALPASFCVPHCLSPGAGLKPEATELLAAKLAAKPPPVPYG